MTESLQDKFNNRVFNLRDREQYQEIFKYQVDKIFIISTFISENSLSISEENPEAPRAELAPNPLPCNTEIDRKIEIDIDR